MYRPLGAGELTTGELLELGVVEAPDADWADRLVPFLRHKGPDYNAHIERALRGPLDELQTRFYVGHVDGEVVTHVMVAGARGVGVFAHVYTAPSWRRRGAFGQLMAAQMADVEALGFTRLTLVTRFGGVPYDIYSSFGFRSVAPESGEMCWLAHDARTAREGVTAQPSELSVRATKWSDWGAYVFALVHPASPLEKTPRSPAVGIDDHGSAEGSFLRLLAQTEHPEARSRVLERADGAIVGWCHVVPSPLVLGDTWLLDLHVLPGFEESLPRLLYGLTWPRGPVLFGATFAAPYAEQLAAAGFAEVGRLPSAATRRGDMVLWWRRP